MVLVATSSHFYFALLQSGDFRIEIVREPRDQLKADC